MSTVRVILEQWCALYLGLSGRMLLSLPMHQRWNTTNRTPLNMDWSWKRWSSANIMGTPCLPQIVPPFMICWMQPSAAPSIMRPFHHTSVEPARMEGEGILQRMHSSAALYCGKKSLGTTWIPWCRVLGMGTQVLTLRSTWPCIAMHGSNARDAPTTFNVWFQMSVQELDTYWRTSLEIIQRLWQPWQRLVWIIPPMEWGTILRKLSRTSPRFLIPQRKKVGMADANISMDKSSK